MSIEMTFYFIVFAVAPACFLVVLGLSALPPVQHWWSRMSARSKMRHDLLMEQEGAKHQRAMELEREARL